MSQDHANSGAPRAGSHGEGTTKPDGRAEARPDHDRTDSNFDIRDEVRPDDIYGGRSDVVGYEDDVEGASEDAAG